MCMQISAWEVWTKEKALNESKVKASPNPVKLSPKESPKESKSGPI
jgi:hypothetical protein